MTRSVLGSSRTRAFRTRAGGLLRETYHYIRNPIKHQLPTPAGFDHLIFVAVLMVNVPRNYTTSHLRQKMTSRCAMLSSRHQKSSEMKNRVETIEVSSRISLPQPPRLRCTLRAPHRKIWIPAQIRVGHVAVLPKIYYSSTNLACSSTKRKYQAFTASTTCELGLFCEIATNSNTYIRRRWPTHLESVTVAQNKRILKQTDTARPTPNTVAHAHTLENGYGGK